MLVSLVMGVPLRLMLGGLLASQSAAAVIWATPAEEAVAEGVSGMWSVLWFVVLAALAGWLSGGLFRMGLRHAGGVRPDPKTLLEPASTFWSLLCATVLLGLLWLAILACALGLVTAVLCVPGLALAGLSMYVHPMIVSDGVGVWTAVRRSWQANAGNVVGATMFALSVWIAAAVLYTPTCLCARVLAESLGFGMVNTAVFCVVVGTGAATPLVVLAVCVAYQARSR